MHFQNFRIKSVTWYMEEPPIGTLRGALNTALRSEARSRTRYKLVGLLSATCGIFCIHTTILVLGRIS